MKPVIPILFILGAADCDVLGPGTCLDIRKYGITLLVLDAQGGAIASDSVPAIAVDGEYADTTTRHTQGAGWARAGLAAERAGTYRVEVHADGYESWARTDVRVSEGECHVRTVDLEVLLKPLSQSPAP